MKAMLYDSTVILIYNQSAKSGTNQTAFMLKLGDEQLTSNVSMIKVMICDFANDIYTLPQDTASSLQSKQ